MKIVFRTAAALLLAATVAAPALAQTLTGSIAGTIKDEQGAVLPGVTVTLTGKQGVRTRVTDSQRGLPLPRARSRHLRGRRPTCRASPRRRARNLVISPGRELAIDLQMKVGRRRGEHHRRRRVAGGRRQEQRDRDDDLAVAPLQRADHPHRDQRAQLRARHQQQLRLRRRRGLRQRAAHRRRRYARPERRHRLDVLQLQHGRGVPVPGARRAGGIRRLHRRGGQHHHQVGRQPLLRPVRLLRHQLEPGQQQRLRDDRGGRTRTSPIRRRPRSTPTSRPSSAGRSSRTSCSSSCSAQRFLLETDPSGRVTERHEVSPRLNVQADLAAEREQQLHRAHPVPTPTTSSGRAGVSALIATDQLTNREDAPEYVWMTQWRHMFNSNTFLEAKYTGWWGFYDLNPESKTSRGHVDDQPVSRPARRAGSTTPTATATRSTRRDPLRRQVRPPRAEVRRRDSSAAPRATATATTTASSSTTTAASPYYAYGYGYDIAAQEQRQSLFAQDAWHADQPPDHQRRASAATTCRAPARAAATSTAAATGRPGSGRRFDLTGDNRTVVKGSYGLVLRRGADPALHPRAARRSPTTSPTTSTRGRARPGIDRRQAVRALQGGGRHQAPAGRRSDASGSSAR